MKKLENCLEKKKKIKKKCRSGRDKVPVSDKVPLSQKKIFGQFTVNKFQEKY